MDLKDAQVGDVLERLIGSGGAAMQLTVTEVDDEFVKCGDWTFERANGVEYDSDLGWGSRFGMTGSVIVAVYKPPKEK